MTLPTPPDLRIRHMRVIWRDTFVVERPPADFLETSRERLRHLPIYRADRYTRRHDQPVELNVLERVSRGVARIGHDSLLRVQFGNFRVADLNPTLRQYHAAPENLTPEQVTEAASQATADRAWVTVVPMLALHRAGVGIMAYYATFIADEGAGFTAQAAIERVRIGINTQLLRLHADWRSILPGDPASAGIYALTPSVLRTPPPPAGEGQEKESVKPEWYHAAGATRDLSQLIAARLSADYAPVKARRSRRQQREMARQQAHLEETPRPTGSTTVVLVETEPRCTADFAAFVDQYAYPLRGIGAMDSYYRERAPWLVERELTDNLSPDTEAGVYLLGNSELILYNDLLNATAKEVSARLNINRYHATTYLYAHYMILMEWVYLQDALLRAYIQRLDAIVSSRKPDRRQMIATLQGALADLIQYQEDITPFASRVDFLERARAYHKLDRMAEQFEHKQEVLFDYVSEFHDYREARATEFLNWLAGILTGAALGELIVTLAGIPPEQTALYLGVRLGSIVFVLGVMGALLQIRR